MYINNEDFEKWMQKLSKKLSEIGQDGENGGYPPTKNGDIRSLLCA